MNSCDRVFWSKLYTARRAWRTESRSATDTSNSGTRFRVIEEALVVIAEQNEEAAEQFTGKQPLGDVSNCLQSAVRNSSFRARYMGYMRQLKPRQKARIKALKAKNGYNSAIRLAKQLAAR
jgi:hypothetical protein